MTRNLLGWVFRPLTRSTFLVLLGACLVLRIYLAFDPGYVNDMEMYKQWAVNSALNGLASAYETTSIDYPPLFLYVLYGVGKLYLALAGTAAEPGIVPDSAMLTLLVKTPHLIADLLLGWLLYRLVGRNGLWGATRSGSGWGRLAAVLYLWNPAVLFGSAYWGQPDGIHSLMAIAALSLLVQERMVASGAALSAASLMKPLAAPLVPLMALTAVVRKRWHGALGAGLGGLTAAVAAFLPFILTGRIEGVLRKVLLDVEAMPFTSANGHNLWWILGAWRDANAPVLGPLSPKLLGLLLFGTVYLFLLLRSGTWLPSRRLSPADYGARMFVLAAAVTVTFFFLSTHMHENHLFMALPLLIAVAGRSRSLGRLAVACGLAIFVNMVLHDPELPHRLPGLLSALSPFDDPHLGRYTWLQVVGSFFNSVLVGAIAYRTCAAAWRGAA